MQVNDLEDEEIEDVFVLDRDMDGPDSRGELHGDIVFKHFPADLEEQITALLRAIRKASPDAVPDKRKRDEISVTAIHRTLQLRLAQYPTTEEQDMAIVQKIGERLHMIGASGSQNVAEVVRPIYRHRLATIVRVGEKKLLKEAIQFAETKMSALNEPGNAAEPSAKRKKTSR
jgi:N-lysine methyltransferase SETD6